MFKIVTKGKENGNRQKTLVQSQESNKYYIVSSVENIYADETMIFPAREDGEIDSFIDVFVVYPNQHNNVLDNLRDGTLTEIDFYYNGRNNDEDY